MLEYGFSLTRIFPYQNTIIDSVLKPENTGHRKPVFRHILRSGESKCDALRDLVAFAQF